MLAPGASYSSANSLAANTGGQAQASYGAGSGSSARQALPQALFAHIARHVATFTPGLEQLLKSFWGEGVDLRFFTASPKVQYFWRQDDFYVSQAGNNIHIRLSDNGCALLLDKTLGKREDVPQHAFSFSALTGFEASLLTSFSKEALTFLARHLIQSASLKPSAPNAPQKAITPDNPLVHLIWVLSAQSANVESGLNEDIEAGKLILSLPLAALKIPPLSQSRQPNDEFPQAWVYHAMSTVDLGIGAGKLPVSAIEEIEADDIIVLEESNTGELFLLDPQSGKQAKFPVKLLSPKAITRSDIQLPADTQKNDPNKQESHTMSPNLMDSDSRQALLDNLMIDVGAQFTPVKMPLHQIKQMSEGLIVEVGDLVHNEVVLTVEGKPLALGELVIVGDKFGVRVVALTPDGESMPERPIKAYPSPMPEAMKEEARQSGPKAAAPAPSQAAPGKEAAPAKPESAQAPKAEPAPAPPVDNAPAPSTPAPAAETSGELNDDFLNDDFDDDDDDW